MTRTVKPPFSPLTERLRLRLQQLEQKSQSRELRVSAHSLNFCSNDYLDLSRDHRLRAALLNGIDRSDRIGSTGSRLLSGHEAIWDELEEEFAAFAGTEASLFFNSGFAANTGLLGSLLHEGDLVFSDARNHASIIDGIRISGSQKVIYAHTDMTALKEALRAYNHWPGAKLIVTESIFSMDGDLAPLVDIFKLAALYDAEVIVDEAHATGVRGPFGRGLAAEHGLQPLATVHTCGKALASPGAFVCGSKTLRKFLINHARPLMFSTALPPYCAWQIRAALRLAMQMDRGRDHLDRLSRTLRDRLSRQGYCIGSSSSHIVPLIVGSNETAIDLATALETHKISVRAIRHPTVPAAAARLRLSVTTRLNMDDIMRFIEVLIKSFTPGYHHA